MKARALAMWDLEKFSCWARRALMGAPRGDVAATRATVLLSGHAKGGSFLQIEDPRGIEVACREGQVWITQIGDPQDHVLTAGETLRFRGKGAALVTALRRAAMVVVIDRRASADAELAPG